MRTRVKAELDDGDGDGLYIKIPPAKFTVPAPPAPEPPDSAGIEAIEFEQEDGNRKSGTFKQSWSVAEQHLLEKLLKDYPNGTKKRSDYHS